MTQVYNVQNAITIYRLRNGDSLNLSFKLTKQLHQIISKETGVIFPDWSVESEQPVITPIARSTMGAVVTTSFYGWEYNGNDLNFSGEIVGEWQKDLTGKFAIRWSDGSLKIIQNLASETNIAGDILTFKCTATVSGVEYNISGTLSVTIIQASASAYYMHIQSTTDTLTSETPTATLTVTLLNEMGKVEAFEVEWFKDYDEETAWKAQSAANKSIIVTRDDISGAQLFIAKAYKPGGTTPLCQFGIIIKDLADTYHVDMYISSPNQIVAPNKDVEVSGRIVNLNKPEGNQIENPANAAWKLRILSKEDWVVLDQVLDNKITVTTSHTDRGGVEYESVIVLGEVTF